MSGAMKQTCEMKLSSAVIIDTAVVSRLPSMETELLSRGNRVNLENNWTVWVLGTGFSSSNL